MWLAVVLKLFMPGSEQYAADIEKQAKRYKFDPLLVAAVVFKESGFKKDSCYKGSHGLMQIQLRPRSCEGSMARAIELGLYQPSKNIERGVRMMATWRRWWRKYHKDDGYHWLLHYNRGFGSCPDGKKYCPTVERRPTSAGSGYADRVLKIYRRLKKIRVRPSPTRRPARDLGGVVDATSSLSVSRRCRGSA